MPRPIPTIPADITADWLTQALCAANAVSSSRVKSAKISRIGEDEAFTWGGLYRITPTYDPPSPTAPKSLVAKLSSSDPETRSLMQRANAREVDFYQTLAQARALPVPHCYHTDFDPSSGTSIVLLQDLGHLRSVPFIKGCGPSDAMAVVRAMAHLHGTWWNDKRLDDMNGSTILVEFPLRQMWPSYADAVGDMLQSVEIPKDFLALGDHIAQHDTAIFAALMDKGPITCLHRDLQIDNVLFETPTKHGAAILLDWQFAGRGRGAYDLGYFLISSVEPAQRRNMERGLVALYHAELLRHGVTDYALAQCWADYLQAVAGKLLMTVAATVLLDNSSPHKKAWRRADLTRLMAFCADHHISPATFAL